MPLPEGGNITWPPEPWRPVYAQLTEHAAWYAGDPEQLAAVYGGKLTHRGRRPWYRFWERAGREREEHQTRSQLHVPLAGDIAATNAALLFSEAPDIRIPAAHAERAPADAKAAEERLHEILAVGDVLSRLTEAAESAAALGGVYLKVDWDRGLISVPLLTVVQADAAIPEFRHGILTAVTLWRVVRAEGETVWRHVERHEVGPDGRGVILHGLYQGRPDRLGERRPLTALPETAGFAEVVPLPFPGLGIRYIPNMRPNRRFRALPIGQSDYAGSEGLLDALDETFTSWMRDIRLGKARILVPEEYLRVNEDGRFLFDLDQEVFTPLDAPPGAESDAFHVSPQQFAIRVEEHERTALALVERIVSHAGYSPQTFGLEIQGRAESGTALRIRERRTLMTQQRKRHFWEQPLEDLFQMMLTVDREIFRSGVTVFRPAVTIADSLTPDDREVAETVDILARAGAASTEILVRMVHPDWDEEQVMAEVERIRAEKGLSLPDPMQVGMA